MDSVADSGAGDGVGDALFGDVLLFVIGANNGDVDCGERWDAVC